MPFYEFEDVADGSGKLLEFSSDEICNWGEVVEHEGRHYRRVFTLPQLQTGFQPVSAMSIPRETDPETQRRMVHEGRADAFDAEGKPQFHTAKTAKKYADASGGAITWDD